MEKENFSDELKSELIALRDSAINGYEQHKNEFIALEAGYINLLSKAQRKSLTSRRKSALTPNLIRPKVNKIVRDLMKAFFGNDDLAEIKSYGGYYKDERISKALKAEIKEYSRDNNLYTQLKPVATEALVYGTAVVKCYWSMRENTFKVERVRLDDVYLDPYAPSALEIKYLVHRVSSMTIADIEAQYKGVKVDWENQTDNSLYMTRIDNSQNNDIGKYQRVEFHEVYRKKGTKWYVSTILNDGTILRADKYLKDGLPFIVGTLDPQFVMINEPVMPVRAYGDSFIAPLLSLQNENTIKRNQQIDATDIQLNQRFITTKESGVREDDLISNRKKIVVDNINNIRELPIPRLNDSIFDVNQINKEAEEISGITKLSEGISTGRGKTATEVEALQMQGSNVIDDIARAFNENFFRPLVQRLVKFTYKYKKTEAFVGMDIDRSRPLRQKVIINVGIGSINKALEIDNLDKSIQTVMQSLQLFMQVQDMQRVQKYMQMLDDINMEKLKLLGQDSIIEKANDKQEEQEETQETQQIQQQGVMQ